jgi:hypothetical protein
MSDFHTNVSFLQSEMRKIISEISRKRSRKDEPVDFKVTAAKIQHYFEKIVLKELPEADQPHYAIAVSRPYCGATKNKNDVQLAVYDIRESVGKTVRHHDGREYTITEMDKETVQLTREARQYRRSLVTFSQYFEFVNRTCDKCVD